MAKKANLDGVTIGDIDFEGIVQSREGGRVQCRDRTESIVQKMQAMSLTFPVRWGSGIRGRPDPDSQCTALLV